MTNLTDLEQRLVRAVGADREIDALIFNSLPDPEYVQVAWKEDNCTELRRLGCDVQFHDGWLIRKAGEHPAKYANDLPRYTASLDAAIALCERVLPDREWAVGIDKENCRHWARIGDDHWDEACADIIAERKGAALALSLAIIRALQAKDAVGAER